MENAVSQRRKAFATAHKSDEDQQAYISALRHARLSLLKPRLRHDRRHALLSLFILTLNLCILSFVLSLALLLHLSPPLTSPTVPLRRNRLRSLLVTRDSTFLSPTQRPCVTVPEATFPSSDEPRALSSLIRLSAPLSPPAKFLAAATNLSLAIATGPDKVAYPKLKNFPRPGMDFLLHIFNLSFHLEDIFYYSHRQDRKASRLSCFLPAYLSYLLRPKAFLNALFYRIYSSSWSLIPFSLSDRQVSALDGLLWIKFCSFLSPFQMCLTNPGRALK